MEKILPKRIFFALKKDVNLNKLYEIRIRAGQVVVVNENSVYRTLFDRDEYGVKKEPIIACREDINYILLEACEHSLYSYENQIKQGYITTSKGIRIGLCGEVAVNKTGDVISIKNISSLVIRIPHEIKNCALTAVNIIMNHNKNEIKNTLIIAPPGAGKTTFLRDIAREISCGNISKNVLICDERGEIASVLNGKPQLDVGNSDVLSYASKEYAFREGVRALRPDVLICDELMNESDVKSCERLSTQGVKIIASVHGKSRIDLINKPTFNNLLANKVFERYIILSCRNGVGTYECVLDENFEVIF